MPIHNFYNFLDEIKLLHISCHKKKRKLKNTKRKKHDLSNHAHSFSYPSLQSQTRNRTRIHSDIQTINPESLAATRRSLLHHRILLFSLSRGDAFAKSAGKFVELAGSSGVKALELHAGSGATPRDMRLLSITTEGWQQSRSGDLTYDHKDETGYSIPFHLRSWVRKSDLTFFRSSELGLL